MICPFSQQSITNIYIEQNYQGGPLSIFTLIIFCKLILDYLIFLNDHTYFFKIMFYFVCLHQLVALHCCMVDFHENAMQFRNRRTRFEEYYIALFRSTFKYIDIRLSIVAYGCYMIWSTISLFFIWFDFNLEKFRVI